MSNFRSRKLHAAATLHCPSCDVLVLSPIVLVWQPSRNEYDSICDECALLIILAARQDLRRMFVKGV